MQSVALRARSVNVQTTQARNTARSARVCLRVGPLRLERAEISTSRNVAVWAAEDKVSSRSFPLVDTLLVYSDR